MDIQFVETAYPKKKPTDESNLGFGKVFTDYMFCMDWEKDMGWYSPRIVPFGMIQVSPASTVLHYGVEIFEGLKAYRTADGHVQLFRPMENAKRLNSSASRLSIPTIPEEDILEAITTLVSLEKDWVPHSAGTSMYIRPFIFGDDMHLGVHGIKHAHFYIFVSPSGSYYPNGISPVKIMIEDADVRAVRGGTGYAKCGGNYAASLRAADAAEAKGYNQVLWLDGVDRKYIEEVGAMNIMFKINGKVVTPMLNGSILPGITRKSILELLRYEGQEPEERLISVDELVESAENGTLEEAWGCGTAAVVSPVGWLAYKGKEYCINGGKIGSTTQHIYDELTAIQWGRKPDPLNWIYPIS